MKTIGFSLYMLTVLSCIGCAPSLATLEREARAFAYREAGYHTYGGTTLYWHARNLERVGQQFLGMTITYGAPHWGAVGTTSLSARQIVVAERLTWNERFEVLAHELGHVLQPHTLSQSEGEVFAEGVGFLVGQRVGHPSGLAASARYLAAHKQSLHVLREYATELHWAAEVLTP